MSATQDFQPPFDPTGYPQIDGAQLFQYLSGCGPYTDTGFTVVTSDIATVPQVPDAATTTKWQRYLWIRRSATSVGAYVWNPTATSDATYLKWVSINIAALGVGVIQGYMIADNTITDNKILSLDWSKLTGVPTGFLPTGAAGGDLTGTYPDPSIATSAVTTTKIADVNVTTGKIADEAVTNAKIEPSGVGLTIKRTNAGATAVEDAVVKITELANPAGGQALNFIRVNAGGTAFEYQTPSQVATDIGVSPTIAQAKAVVTGRNTNGAATLNGTSVNVASVTRSGAGVYDVVFTAALANTNYAVIVSSTNTLGGSDGTFALYKSKTVNGFTINTAVPTLTYADPDEISFVVF